MHFSNDEGAFMCGVIRMSQHKRSNDYSEDCKGFLRCEWEISHELVYWAMKNIPLSIFIQLHGSTYMFNIIFWGFDGLMIITYPLYDHNLDWRTHTFIELNISITRYYREFFLMLFVIWCRAFSDYLSQYYKICRYTM